MLDFGNENVIQDATEAFAETIGVKLRQLRRYVPKRKAMTNPALTGAFIEELVRGFVRRWIGHKQLLHGTFYYQKHVDANEKSLQIDGIVYDPMRGPEILREGDFVVVHPAFCGGVIEIKMSYSSVWAFEDHLQEIYNKYLGHRTKPSVMGVLISSSNPAKDSEYSINKGTGTGYLFDHAVANVCPIFILFKEDDGDFEPYLPAIQGMIRAIYHNLWVTTNYL